MAVERHIAVAREYLANGRPIEEAAVMAGYSPRDATRAGRRAVKRLRDEEPSIYDSMRRIGAGKRYIAKKIKSLMDARTTRFFADKGIVTDSRTVADNATRMKAVELAAQIAEPHNNGNNATSASAIHITIGDGAPGWLTAHGHGHDTTLDNVIINSNDNPIVNSNESITVTTPPEVASKVLEGAGAAPTHAGHGKKRAPKCLPKRNHKKGRKR